MMNKVLTIALILGICLTAVAFGVEAFSGPATIVVENGTFNVGGEGGMSLGGATNFDYVDTANGYYVDGTQIIDGSGNFDGAVTGTTGTFSSTLDVTGALSVTGATTLAAQVNQTPGTITATTTLTAASPNIQLLSGANQITVTLPAIAAATGTSFRFQVAAALSGAAVIIDSAEGDNIEGTLIVAGAVVDCDAEDQVNIITDGENLGDYFELYTNGQKWFLVDSGALTSAKMTCTDPS